MTLNKTLFEDNWQDEDFSGDYLIRRPLTRRAFFGGLASSAAGAAHLLKSNRGEDVERSPLLYREEVIRKRLETIRKVDVTKSDEVRKKYISLQKRYNDLVKSQDFKIELERYQSPQRRSHPYKEDLPGSLLIVCGVASFATATMFSDNEETRRREKRQLTNS